MIKNIAKNPVARHNYIITDTLEAGIVLTGTEIKSIRNGKVNLKDSYAGIKNGEAYIYSMHISPYEKGNIFNKDPLRERKLLLNKREIYRLIGLTKQKGYTLVPISLYFKNKDELISHLKDFLLPGDTILVKASHSMHFEEVIDAI